MVSEASLDATDKDVCIMTTAAHPCYPNTPLVEVDGMPVYGAVLQDKRSGHWNDLKRRKGWKEKG